MSKGCTICGEKKAIGHSDWCAQCISDYNDRDNTEGGGFFDAKEGDEWWVYAVVLLFAALCIRWVLGVFGVV